MREQVLKVIEPGGDAVTPVSPLERIELLDVLRGFALLDFLLLTFRQCPLGLAAQRAFLRALSRK